MYNSIKLKIKFCYLRPGTYDTPSRCRTTKMCQTFGGPRKMKPAIETLCIARPIDRCIMCNEICDGDYWHKDETIYICSICMMIERIRHKQFATKELKEFQVKNYVFKHIFLVISIFNYSEFVIALICINMRERRQQLGK